MSFKLGYRAINARKYVRCARTFYLCSSNLIYSFRGRRQGGSLLQYLSFGHLDSPILLDVLLGREEAFHLGNHSSYFARAGCSCCCGYSENRKFSSDIRSEGSIAIVKKFDFDFLMIFLFYITPRV